jgi:hypothetical protein
MSSLDQSAWEAAGAAYHLSNRVKLLAGGAVFCDGETLQLEDGQETDVPDGEGYRTVCYLDGLWSYSKSIHQLQLDVVTIKRMRVRWTGSLGHTALPVNPTVPQSEPIDAERWPRWKLSELAALCTVLLVVAIVAWMLLK